MTRQRESEYPLQQGKTALGKKTPRFQSGVAFGVIFSGSVTTTLIDSHTKTIGLSPTKRIELELCLRVLGGCEGWRTG
jgi:hypothetical protein